MRVIKGPLDKLISREVYEKEDTNDYIKAILEDKDQLIEPLSRLRAVYPNIMEIEREIKLNLGDSRKAATEGFKEKSEAELFKEFYKSMCNEDMTDEEFSVLEEAIKEVMKDEVR